MASKLERARQSTSRLRSRIKQAQPLEALGAFGGGAGAGTLERMDILPATVVGFPSKPVVASLLYLFAARASVGSTTHAVTSGMAHGVLGAYGYAAGRSGTLIAGDDADE